jgi:hypothetical protein
MSFSQSGESTFPDSRNPVRMNTEDQSFAGKPSHGTHDTHGTQGTDSTHATHGTHGNLGTHGTDGTYGTDANNNNNNNNVSTFTEIMPLTGAPLVHHVHRDDEPLPGAKGGAKTFDYSAENIENSNDFPTEGSGQSQAFRSGGHTGTGTGYGQVTGGGIASEAGIHNSGGGHANTARAYGGSTTEGSGDFRGPTIASTTDRRDLSSGVNPTHGSNDHTSASNFGSGRNDKDLFAEDGNNNNMGSNDHNTSSHISQPVGDLKPHTGNNNASVGRTDNYNTVSAAGNHDLNNPSHHTGVTGGANKSPYDGAGDEPTNKPSMGDKIIGKTEQIAGKITNNPGLQEKGEIRKAGLKN